MNEMRKPRAGLGRGLSALLGDIASDDVPTRDAGTAPGLRMLPVSALTPHPDQPRRRFEESALDELAASIAQRGLIQPIVVRAHGHDYQIVAGERRWRAAQRAQLHEVPVIVRDFTDAETLEVALLENIQRQDLNAIEEAEAYRRLLGDFGHTQEALARIVNKSRSHIANLLRLLDLPQPIQARVIDGAITMGHARALIGVADAERLAERVVAEGLSVRQIERIARGEKGRASGTPSTPAAENPDIIALEHQLADMLGLVVRIAHDDAGGVLTLEYTTLDQLDMVCQRLSGEAM